jgi:two-component system response regulator ResD
METAPSKKILIIDDDEAIQSVLKTLLELEGYEVMIADDGQRAIDLFLKERLAVNLILLDLYMPKMDGWQFAETLRAQGSEIQKKIPIIITSATNKPPEKNETSPFNAFLRKPFNLEDLIDTCNRFTH